MPSTSGTTIKSTSDITKNWVEGLAGGTLYSPGGTANVGGTTLNLNSTKSDLKNAFPTNTQINNAPSGFILKNDYPNLIHR